MMSDSPDGVVLEYSDATKHYRSHVAIEAVTMQVRPRQTWALLGPNGSGKSTLIRLALGQATPSSGTARLFGVPFGELTSPGRRVGAQTDKMGFETGMTARTHLRIVAGATGTPRSHVDEALRSVDLMHAERVPFGRFSTGMKQRLGFAAAILAKPPLLILDEPFNGLDLDSTERHINYIERHRAEGGASLVATHHIPEIIRIATHVAVVLNRLIWQGPVDEFTRSDSVGAVDAYRHVLREGSPR